MEHKFIFQNFIPSAHTETYSALKFNQIWGETPSDSNVSANVVKDSESEYHTYIEITAACGRFRAEAKDKVVLASIKRATAKLSEVMKQWKSSRF